MKTVKPLQTADKSNSQANLPILKKFMPWDQFVTLSAAKGLDPRKILRFAQNDMQNVQLQKNGRKNQTALREA